MHLQVLTSLTLLHTKLASRGKCIFCGVSFRRHDVQDVPLPHDGRESPAGAGADGRERPVAEHPQAVCQAAAGGGRGKVQTHATFTFITFRLTFSARLVNFDSDI